jgi:hypothetical protein
MCENSDDVKRELLQSEAAFSGAFLNYALDAEYTDVPGPHTTLLAEYNDEQLNELTPHYDNQDTDLGPFEAWYAAHESLPRNSWVLFPDNAGRRECAYVLWDGDRIETYDLLEQFENTSGGYDETLD